MIGLYIGIGVLFFLIIIFFVLSYVCFRFTFYAPNSKKVHKEGALPPGEIYEPYYDAMRKLNEETKKIKFEEVFVTSYDGLKLYGKLYELFPGNTIEIMFHGYRGSGERDLCGAVQRCIKLKRNVLIVDQRSHGKSQGNVITFGIRERLDVKTWADFVYEKMGKNVPIIITGISMGASTVTMASSLNLPKTVVGVVADCGYSSPKEIIKSVINKIGLPAWLFYPFVKMGGIIYGGFNIEETSAEKEVKNAKVPIVFIHGSSDDFVPCEMSKTTYNACKTKCVLEVFEGAGHAMSYMLEPERYVKILKDFEEYNSK